MPTLFFVSAAIIILAETHLKDSKYLIIIRLITIPICLGLVLLGILGKLDPLCQDSCYP